MFKKTAIIVGIGMAVSAAAQAQQEGEKLQEAIVTGSEFVDTYRWEVGGLAGYSKTDLDIGNIDDIDTWSGAVYGTYYFRDVDTTKGPRSEAPFLDHASNVTLFGGYAEADKVNNRDLGLGDNSKLDIGDGSGMYGIGGRYVMDGSGWGGGWIIEADYRRTKPAGIEVDSYNIGGGKYITENTSLIFTYSDVDPEHGGDSDGWAVGLEHFWSLSSGGIKLEGQAGYMNVDDGSDIDIYHLAGTWYVNDDLGFGAAYGNTDTGGLFSSGSVKSDSYKIFSEWFITRQFAVNASYEYYEFDNSDADINSVTLGALYRFK